MDLPAAGAVFVIFRPGNRVPDATRLEREGVTLVDARDATRVDPGVPPPTQGLKPNEPVQPWVENPAPACEVLEGGRRLLAWEPGRYTLTRNDRSTVAVVASGPRTVPVPGPWTLSFPAGWDAPAPLTLPTLQPWSALTDPATRAFAGTATYAATFTLETVDPDTRVLLDLGRVAVIAEVVVNGHSAATLWGAPYRKEITPYVSAGMNRIEIKVTNPWFNRLAYDASLPEGKRKTWAINSPKAGTPLELAGLVGPVVVRIGRVCSAE